MHKMAGPCSSTNVLSSAPIATATSSDHAPVVSQAADSRPNPVASAGTAHTQPMNTMV